MNRIALTLLATSLLAACGHDRLAPPHLERYVAPRQSALSRSTQPISTAGAEKLRPRAGYELEAYVMSVKPYRMDKLSSISPIDFAVAWGPAATETVQSLLQVTLDNREFSWALEATDRPLFLSRTALSASIAHVHIVPATDDVMRKIKRAVPGSSIRAQGMLVDIYNETGGERVTSLSRTDTGPGSAEIFYVTDIEVLTRN